jgi:hypothetical protein
MALKKIETLKILISFEQRVNVLVASKLARLMVVTQLLQLVIPHPLGFDCIP